MVQENYPEGVILSLIPRALSLHLAIVLPGAAVGFVLRLGIVFKGLARVSARLQQVVEIAFGIVERGNGFGLRHTIGEKPAQG